jgi:hypothetical protein
MPEKVSGPHLCVVGPPLVALIEMRWEERGVASTLEWIEDERKKGELKLRPESSFGGFSNNFTSCFCTKQVFLF